MITDYATLQTSIAGFLHRTDMTAIIQELIADAEFRIANELRIRAMEASFTGTIASGTVALPSAFLEWKHVYIDGDAAQKLERRDAEWIYTNYPTRSATGKPVFFAQEADALMFGPYPDSNYTVKGVYYQKLAALSDSNTTNWFITNAPDLLRYGALCEAAPYMQADERIGVWEQKYNQVKQRIERTERREKSSGSLLTMKAQ
jgi:hypothetical protein